MMTLDGLEQVRVVNATGELNMKKQRNVVLKNRDVVVVKSIAPIKVHAQRSRFIRSTHDMLRLLNRKPEWLARNQIQNHMASSLRYVESRASSLRYVDGFPATLRKNFS